jgi:hypothetical protein
MKLAGFLLLVAGWGIVLSAVAILAAPGQRTIFVLAGLAVEILGIGLMAYTHRTQPGEGS